MLNALFVVKSSIINQILVFFLASV